MAMAGWTRVRRRLEAQLDGLAVNWRPGKGAGSRGVRSRARREDGRVVQQKVGAPPAPVAQQQERVQATRRILGFRVSPHATHQQALHATPLSHCSTFYSSTRRCQPSPQLLPPLRLPGSPRFVSDSFCTRPSCAPLSAPRRLSLHIPSISSPKTSAAASHTRPLVKMCMCRPGPPGPP